ncbi:hypothetical protein A3K64_01155 [Candidatus Micrarchaeota archaeon RBG_16_36_9]|nr:MAG: hypothetical protein A3K64_01155 [Candidatus Micrarchaeota archaeon RBG_16_36_9]
MTMEHQVTEFIGATIVVLIVLIVFFILLDNFTGGKLVRFLVCNILFWLPFGAASSMYCYVIPV